jgi:hypothetical protein
MKFISYAIWILGALLVVAALDALPDPPALNPSSAADKVLQLHDYSCDTAIERCDFFVGSAPSPVALLAAGTYKPWHPSDPMVITGLAADSSPPLLQDGRKLTLQTL